MTGADITTKIIRYVLNKHINRTFSARHSRRRTGAAILVAVAERRHLSTIDAKIIAQSMEHSSQLLIDFVNKAAAK